MHRCISIFTRITVVLLVVAVGVALVFTLGTRQSSKSPQPDTSGASFPVSDPISHWDLDGDGQADVIHLDDQGLTVTTATGVKLLALESPDLEAFQVVALDGPFPVLFVRTGSQKYAAFAYHPGRGLLQAVRWPNGQIHAIGELTPQGALRLPTKDGERPQVVYLSLDRLQLRIRTDEPVSGF